MSQWGFYFNQERCLGCKTCMTSCKNWNEQRRGDAEVNKADLADRMVAVGQNEPRSNYLAYDNRTNYAEFRKYYMKENWRRVSMYDKGHTVATPGKGFQSNFDRRYISLSCNHCDKPACMEVCPVGNIVKDEKTGAVLYKDLCISCGSCKEACPWGAPQYYDAEHFSEYAQDDPARPKMTKCILCYDRINEGLKPACVAACWNRALDAGPVDELIKKYGEVRIIDHFKDLETEPNIIFRPKKG